MFRVFYLSSNVCYNYCIWMFQKRIGCCTSPPRLRYIVLMCPPPSTGRASIRCRGWVLLNQRRCPFSSCRSRSVGPAWSARNGVQRVGVRTWDNHIRTYFKLFFHHFLFFKIKMNWLQPRAFTFSPDWLEIFDWNKKRIQSVLKVGFSYVSCSQ